MTMQRTWAWLSHFYLNTPGDTANVPYLFGEGS